MMRARTSSPGVSALRLAALRPAALRLAAGAAAVFCAGMLASCLGLAAGGGTDVGNPEVTRVSGSIRYTGGSPAPWIRLHLRPAVFLTNPDSATQTTGKALQDGITDTQGFFAFDSVPKGDYRLEARDSSAMGAVVEFTNDGKAAALTLSPALMEHTGSISGRINYVGPALGHFPKVIITVYGMERWTAANDSGDFTLSDLPPGKYKLRIATDTSAAPASTEVPETTLPSGQAISIGKVDLGQ